MPTTIRLLTIIATSAIAAVILASFACSEPPPVFVEQTVEIIKEVQVTVPVEVEREVEVTREVPVTIEIEVIKEVQVTVPVEIEREVEVTREVPVTFEVEVTREVQVQFEVEVTREVPIPFEVQVTREVNVEIPVTVEVPATVEVPIEVTREVETIIEVTPIPTDPTDFTWAEFNDALDIWDADQDGRTALTEVCHHFATKELNLEAHAFVIRIRHDWFFDDERRDHHLLTKHFTNREVCDWVIEE